MRSLSVREGLVYGTVCLALGCYPVAVALGFTPARQADLVAPRWVIAGAGLVFVIAGLMILLANHSRANDLLAGIVLLLFSSIGLWISVFGPDEGFSGGLSFIPPDLNILVGRWVFALGALICFAFCLYALRRATSSTR
jgi:hypothetical protein